jgi:hypothetical protein
MSMAADLMKLYEGAYPADVYFGGGYMPESDEEDDPDDLKDGKKESLAHQFLGKFKEGKWSGDVKTRKHPPEGKFTEGPDAIAKWLKSSHDDFKSAVNALVFFRNRNKDLMSQDKFDKIHGLLSTAYGRA